MTGLGGGKNQHNRSHIDVNGGYENPTTQGKMPRSIFHLKTLPSSNHNK